MEGNRKRKARYVRRRYEGNRLQEQLWTLAYQQVLPQVRRDLPVEAAEEQQDVPPPSAASVDNIARGA